MYRITFIVTYVAAFLVPYAIGFLGINVLNSLALIFFIPAGLTLALVWATYLRGREIEKSWLFSLPLAAGLIDLAVLALMFAPGSPYYGGDGRGDNEKLATMWFTIAPLAGSVAGLIKLVAFFIGARKFTPKSG